MVGVDMATLIPIASFVGVVGAVVGGVVALLKLRPEAGQVTVMAAQGAVIAQTGVINTLREEMARIAFRVDALESERSRLVDEAARLRVENLALRERVLHLEEELHRLRTQLDNGTK